jgi:hypothetical protein
MERIKLEKRFIVKSGKDIEYELHFNAAGISNIEDIESQREDWDNGDLDNPDFSFSFLEEPMIKDITTNIQSIKMIKGEIKKEKFRYLPKKAKEDGYKKIKRHITKYETWEKERKY